MMKYGPNRRRTSWNRDKNCQTFCKSFFHFGSMDLGFLIPFVAMNWCIYLGHHIGAIVFGITEINFAM